jgi:hypothetical protein
MKRIIITLLLLPLSSVAMSPSYKAIISIRSLRSSKDAITRNATIFIDKEHSEPFDFSAPDASNVDKTTVTLLLLNIQGNKAKVQYTIETERVGGGGEICGETKRTEVISMNESTNMNALDRLNALTKLEQVQFDLTLADQEKSTVKAKL